MDFRKLSQALSKSEPPSNITEPTSLGDLPPNILDTLIPGYSLISKYMLAIFGIDISIFVTVAVIFLAATKGGQYVYNRATRAFRYLFLSSVYIDEYDDLFDMLMDWLAAVKTSTSRRSVRAKTQRGNKANDEFAESNTEDALGEDGMFDYNKWSARTPPRYEPYYGQHFLWHNGRLFLFRRSQRETFGQNLQVRFGNSSEDDVIQLDCVGRSIEPLRELLRIVKVWSLQRQRHTTTIRHPTPKDRARFGGMWSKTFSRPSRPMDTVILDSEQKSMIINDMNEYLHPSSPKWYATRGIPYRRGYLFHGPPGTGKTSLSFALAGIFGLEIYVISLQEPTLTEGDLMQLFNGLPRRCIVLLEDVDAAGLIRDGKSDNDNSVSKKKRQKKTKEDKTKEIESKPDSKANTDKKPKEEEFTLKDLARELKSIAPAATPKASRGGNRRPRGGDDGNGNSSSFGISLSGLLNAIDGVASHEGRVLIMTTNHPEKLDSALVRPGRVDRRVAFTTAAKEQVRELFVRMYIASEDNKLTPKPATNGTANGHTNGALKAPSGEKQPNGHIGPTVHSSSPSRMELEELAVEFASNVPDHTFTPAEIQNHLMRYKKQPRTALEKVDDWMKETLDEKKKLEDADESKTDSAGSEDEEDD